MPSCYLLNQRSIIFILQRNWRRWKPIQRSRPFQAYRRWCSCNAYYRCSYDQRLFPLPWLDINPNMETHGTSHHRLPQMLSPPSNHNSLISSRHPRYHFRRRNFLQCQYSRSFSFTNHHRQSGISHSKRAHQKTPRHPFLGHITGSLSPYANPCLSSCLHVTILQIYPQNAPAPSTKPTRNQNFDERLPDFYSIPTALTKRFLV